MDAEDPLPSYPAQGFQLTRRHVLLPPVRVEDIVARSCLRFRAWARRSCRSIAISSGPKHGTARVSMGSLNAGKVLCLLLVAG